MRQVPTNAPSSRLGAYLSWSCGLSSAVLFLLTISLAAHVRLGLGHWPRPMFEDYQTRAFAVHEWALIGVAFFAVYGAAPLWVVLVCLKRFRLPWRAHAAQAGIFLAAWGLLAGLIALNPFRFVSWFAD